MYDPECQHKMVSLPCVVKAWKRAGAPESPSALILLLSVPGMNLFLFLLFLVEEKQCVEFSL